MRDREFSVLHLFCGLGGGALGFQAARSEWRGAGARFKTVLGVDVDPAACRDFARLTGAPALCADVHELTPEALAEACGERPDVVFSSPPCQGYSGLLSNKAAAKPKYEKLNRLVLEGLALVLGAWEKPPALILIENVPKIATRGAELLRHARQLLTAHGYVFHEGAHDCGELGGLAQHRRRYLLIARHERQVPTFVYHPPVQRVRACGEVLEKIPLPDAPEMGPMHRLPRLQWKTWVRLALIPAGKDWRALGTRQDGPAAFNNCFRIVPWSEPSVAVTGGGTPTAGGIAVADPRLLSEHHRGSLGIAPWTEPLKTVTGNGRPESGPFSVADPRVNQGAFFSPYGNPDPRLASSPGSHANHYRVLDWEQPAHVVAGAASLAGGAPAVADPRFGSPGLHEAKMRVERWDRPAHAVTGSDRVGSGAPSVADPRINGKGSRPDLFGVLAWDQPAKTISGSARVSASNCAAAVADPRLPADHERLDPPPLIVALDGTWHRPLTTLELAALQDLPIRMPDGSPLVLDGKSHTAYRRRIGNCVPVGTAKAIAGEILKALLQCSMGATFVLGSGGIWVEEDRRKGIGNGPA